MRVSFSSPNKLLGISKNISKETNLKLSLCQNAFARACGYKDFHDYQNNQNISDNQIIHDYVSTFVDIIYKFNQETEANCGDVLNALSYCKLLNNRNPALQESIDIRATLFRKIEIPFIGKNQKGDVGYMETSIGSIEKVIFVTKENDDFIIFIDNIQNGEGGCYIDEYKSTNNEYEFFIPERMYCAYGYWKLETGSKILFNRDYRAIWKIVEGKRPQRINPNIKLGYADSKNIHHFWNPNDRPLYNEQLEILTSFGINQLPITVEALPYMVNKINETTQDMIYENIYEKAF